MRAMTQPQQMELLSMAYIRTVATQAGCQVVRPELDDDSVDGILMARFGERPRLEFQAKATFQDILRGDSLHFPLSLKNYDDLRSPTRIPRILIVFLTPEENSLRLEQTEQELRLRHCAYWLSLENYTSKPNVSSVTVLVPTTNILNVDQLVDLMEKVERGDSL